MTCGPRERVVRIRAILRQRSRPLVTCIAPRDLGRSGAKAMIKSVLACDETTLLNLLLPVVHRSSRSSGFVPLGAVGYIPTPICEVETHHIRVLSAFLVSPGVRLPVDHRAHHSEFVRMSTIQCNCSYRTLADRRVWQGPCRVYSTANVPPLWTPYPSSSSPRSRSRHARMADSPAALSPSSRDTSETQPTLHASIVSP